MIDELVEAVVPGGAWLVAGVAIGASLAGVLRPVAKTAVKTGMVVADRVQELTGEAVEQAQDLVAEARMEREQDRAAKAAAPPPPRSGRGRAQGAAEQR